jgi:hypothetical protein
VTYDLRARPLLVILFLCVLAAAVGLFALQRGRSNDSSSTSGSAAPTVPRAHAARKAAASHRATATPARPKPKVKAKPKPKPKPVRVVEPGNKLPVAISEALAADDVVVVALYDPRAKIDGTAMAEARAGAEKAGSSFVPIDVRGKGVESLNAKYGVLQDPAVLVLRPPGLLVVRIDGFADRDTVAQAALNAT